LQHGLHPPARNGGYSANLFNKKQEKNTGSGRLRGKARKLAREAAAAAPKKGPEQKVPRYTIANDDLTVLAEYLAGKKGVKVPDTS
jgi:hypothetical protein